MVAIFTPVPAGPPVMEPSATGPAAGIAHEPSPRQKVVADAFVPLAKFDTARLPVMLEAVPVVFWFKVGMSEGVKAAPLVTRPFES